MAHPRPHQVSRCVLTAVRERWSCDQPVRSGATHPSAPKAEACDGSGQRQARTSSGAYVAMSWWLDLRRLFFIDDELQRNAFLIPHGKTTFPPTPLHPTSFKPPNASPKLPKPIRPRGIKLQRRESSRDTCPQHGNLVLGTARSLEPG